MAGVDLHGYFRHLLDLLRIERPPFSSIGYDASVEKPGKNGLSLQLLQLRRFSLEGGHSIFEVVHKRLHISTRMVHILLRLHAVVLHTPATRCFMTEILGLRARAGFEKPCQGIRCACFFNFGRMRPRDILHQRNECLTDSLLSLHSYRVSEVRAFLCYHHRIEDRVTCARVPLRLLLNPLDTAVSSDSWVEVNLIVHGRGGSRFIAEEYTIPWELPQNKVNIISRGWQFWNSDGPFSLRLFRIVETLTSIDCTECQPGGSGSAAASESHHRRDDALQIPKAPPCGTTGRMADLMTLFNDDRPRRRPRVLIYTITKRTEGCLHGRLAAMHEFLLLRGYRPALESLQASWQTFKPSGVVTGFYVLGEVASG